MAFTGDLPNFRLSYAILAPPDSGSAPGPPPSFGLGGNQFWAGTRSRREPRLHQFFRAFGLGGITNDLFFVSREGRSRQAGSPANRGNTMAPRADGPERTSTSMQGNRKAPFLIILAAAA